MADQAPLKASGYPGQRGTPGNGSAGGVVHSIADLGNDVATLAELQAKLAALDLKECTTRSIVPVVVAAVAAAVALGTVPVALLGLAQLATTLLGIPTGWSLLLTALIALAVAGVLLLISVRELSRSVEPLRRSREELVRNLSWIRTVLVHSGRSMSRKG